MNSILAGSSSPVSASPPLSNVAVVLATNKRSFDNSSVNFAFTISNSCNYNQEAFSESIRSKLNKSAFLF